MGANLSVDGVYAFSPSVFQAEDEWQEVALYGRTGTEQTSVIVYARLGGYGGESTGHALFQDLSFTRISQVPDGEMVHNFFIPQPFLEDNAPEGNESNSNLPSYSPHSGNPERNEYNKNAANLLTETASSLILSVSLLFVLFFLGVKDRLSSLPALNEKQPSLHWLWLAGVLVLAFVLRVYAAQKVPGYDVDIGCFTHWANTMATWGPAQFYNKAGFCDYPPGYMYILWIVGLIGQAAGGITELMLTELKDVMAEKGMELSWDDAAADYLTDKSFSETYGARNLRRLIQREVEDAIAAEIIDKLRGAVHRVGLTAKDGKIEVLAV